MEIFRHSLCSVPKQQMFTRSQVKNAIKIPAITLFYELYLGFKNLLNLAGLCQIKALIVHMITKA